METVLIVEDDTYINQLLKEALTKEGYQCIQAFSGSEGKLVLEKGEVDLVLLDLMLPGIPGETVLEEIRKQNETPVIILTAKEELDSKVDLLLAGADDYIIKPFDIREVLARIQVQMRKRGKNSHKQILEYKGLRLDKEQHQVSVDGKVLEGITRQEFQILELFLTWPKKSIWERGNFRSGMGRTICRGNKSN